MSASKVAKSASFPVPGKNAFPEVASTPSFNAASRIRGMLRKLIPVTRYPHFPGTATSMQPMAE